MNTELFLYKLHEAEGWDKLSQHLVKSPGGDVERSGSIWTIDRYLSQANCGNEVESKEIILYLIKNCSDDAIGCPITIDKITKRFGDWLDLVIKYEPLPPKLAISTCLDCTRKHLAQAHINLDESRLGYPAHLWIAIGHLAEAESELIISYPEMAVLLREERKLLEVDANTNLDLKSWIQKCHPMSLSGENEAL